MSVAVRVPNITLADQIVSAVPWTLPKIRFPTVFARLLAFTSIFQVDFMSLVSSDCWFRTNFYEYHAAVTLFPVSVAVVVALGFYVAHTLAHHHERSNIRTKFVFTLLLLSYLCLPLCSSTTFRYFDCSTFDRGEGYDGKRLLRVLDIDRTIKCDSPTYRAWLAFVIITICIWPVGCPLAYLIVLWRERDKIDPAVEADPAGEEDYDRLAPGFAADVARFKVARIQAQKIALRNEKDGLDALELLFAEYEPRCYLFVVFDCLRRIFLTSILALFNEAEVSQIGLAIFGSFLSYRVFSFYAPYVDDEVSLVAPPLGRCPRRTICSRISPIRNSFYTSSARCSCTYPRKLATSSRHSTALRLPLCLFRCSP